MKKHVMNWAVVMLCVGFLYSCNSPQPEATEAPAATEAVDESTEVTPEISVVVNANDQMKYDVSEIRVKAGQKVTLTLNHTGTMAKNVMGHNLVILQQGVDMAAFAQKANSSADTDHIPTGSESEIVAHTKMLGGGESDTIVFDAPSAGEYDFLCTFPGHYALMKGKFIVE